MIDLLTTKLYFPPARSNLIKRPRLLKQLEEGLQGPLTLISAPAGYGKTTLMSEWHANQGRNMPVAWLSLDARDNDPASFWVYMVSALDTLQEGLVSDALLMLQSPQLPSIESLLTVLINELNTFPKDFVFALDDIHVITAPEIFRGVDFILEHMPLHMHLVLLTRADPPLALPRLRGRGQLIEIRARDLSFNSSEATAFLNDMMKLDLLEEEIEALESRTEGWITGLQLAALTIQGREDPANIIGTFGSGYRYIVDFLIEEVLDRQPEHIRNFLLQTSILERMSGPLCNALTGQANGDVTLQQLEQDNLFVFPIGVESFWYRYHHLFADVMKNQLRQTSPDQIPELHSRAARWFEEQGDYIEAIDNFLAAKDFQHAAGLIKLGMKKIFPRPNISQSYNHALLLNWLNDFPEEFIHTDPRLCLYYVNSAWMLGRRRGLEPFLQQAQDAYDRLVAAGEITPDDPEFLMIQFDIYANRSMSAVYTGDLEFGIELAEKALKICPSANLAALADVYISLYLAYREVGRFDEAVKSCSQAITIARKGNAPFGVLDGMNGLGYLYEVQGHLNRAAKILRQAIQFSEERKLMWTILLPITYVKLSSLHYHWNDLTKSENLIEKALTLCEQYSHSMISVYAKIYLARLKLAQGDKSRALEIIQSLQQTIDQEGIDAFKIEIEAYHAAIQAELGDYPNAAAWLEKIDLNIGERAGGWQSFQGIQAAHVMVVLERVDEVLELLGRLEASAEISGNVTCEIEAYVIQAIAWKKKGSMHDAKEALLHALALAAPERYIRVFLNEGLPMCELLKSVRSEMKDKQLIDCIDQLLNAYLPELVGIGAEQAYSQTSQDQLSEREFEVLRLLANGRSNQEIADELVIALGTAKRHIYNIYGKLGVKNRTECVAEARELHLLQ